MMNIQWWRALRANSIWWCLCPLKYSLTIRYSSVADSFSRALIIEWCMSGLIIVENNVNVAELSEWYLKQSSSSMMILRGIPADVNTTSIDGGVYPLILLVVGTGCRRHPSANVYRHDTFNAFSTWSTFSNVLSPRDTQYLFAISQQDCVSLIYFATGTLRDSIVVGEEAASGTGCAVGATAVVITDAGDGENITDRDTLAGIGVASTYLCGIRNCIVSSSREHSSAVMQFPILRIEDSMRNRILPMVLISGRSSTTWFASSASSSMSTLMIVEYTWRPPRPSRSNLSIGDETSLPSPTFKLRYN